VIHRSVAAALAIAVALAACGQAGGPASTPSAPAIAAAPEIPVAERVTVFFGSDSDFIEGIAEETLQRLGQSLREQPADAITIEGYAEAGGAPGFGAELSERRAIAVGRALAAFGVPSDRMQIVGRGEVEPVALAIEGRRVDVTVRRR